MSTTQPTFSRDDDKYVASSHAQQRIMERNFTGLDVEEVIREGEVIEVGSGEGGEPTVTLRHQLGAMYIEVVIATETHTVITACECGRGKN